ncbi:hypothetical protein [Curtobacterium sp. RRHDQ10]|uniref:hypothetical protein n=1 Tax=Curtobacterium phyllosphaerae TaxID=3413379 RepID=UPI003BF1EB66
MTATVPALLDTITRKRLGKLAALDDVALAVQLLRNVPTNENRSDTELAQHAGRALDYGAGLADDHDRADAPATVTERTGGIQDRVLARYNSRSDQVDLYVDTILFCDSLIDEMGWRHWYPAGSVRQAAIDHEHAHHLVTRNHARELRRALDHDAFRVGRWRRLAFIAGADEVAAHAFASANASVGRSFLLLTAAASAALSTRRSASRPSTPSEN